MLCVGQGRLAGAGQAEHRRDIFAAVVQGVFLLAAVAGSVAVAVRNRPGKGQGTLLVLAKVAHAEDCRAVGVGIEVAQALGVADIFLAGSADPLRVGEDIDIRLIAVADRLGFLVHLDVFVRLVLEVQHPVIQQVFLAFRDEQVCLDHEFGVESDEHFCVVHGLPAGIINGVHYNLVERGGINARLAGDAARGGVAAGDGTVVEKQDLGVRLQAELFAAVHGHIGDDRAGGVLSQLVGLPQGVNLYDVISVKRSLNDRAGFGKTDLARADFISGVIGFCRHLRKPSCQFIVS